MLWLPEDVGMVEWNKQLPPPKCKIYLGDTLNVLAWNGVMVTPLVNNIKPIWNSVKAKQTTLGRNRWSKGTDIFSKEQIKWLIIDIWKNSHAPSYQGTINEL